MGVVIHPIPLGTDRCYIIKDKGVIMVDGGVPKKGKNPYSGTSPGNSQCVVRDRRCFCRRSGNERFPLRLGLGLPIFAEDLQKVKNSWSLLLDRGANMIYPAHGNPFSAEIIRKIL